MITNAVFITTLIFMTIGIFLLQECHFLIPYRHVLFMKYGSALALFAAALFMNLFAADLHDLPRVLSERHGTQTRSPGEAAPHGHSLSDELSRRLND